MDLIHDTMFGFPHFTGMKDVDNETYAFWFWRVKDWVTEKDTAPYKLIDFEGGLYAVVVSVDADDDIMNRVYNGIRKWLKTSELEFDDNPERCTLYHMVNPTEEIRGALGYDQLDIYVPIKVRKKSIKENLI